MKIRFLPLHGFVIGWHTLWQNVEWLLIDNELGVFGLEHRGVIEGAHFQDQGTRKTWTQGSQRRATTTTEKPGTRRLKISASKRLWATAQPLKPRLVGDKCRVGMSARNVLAFAAMALDKGPLPFEFVSNVATVASTRNMHRFTHLV